MEKFSSNFYSYHGGGQSKGSIAIGTTMRPQLVSRNLANVIRKASKTSSCISFKSHRQSNPLTMTHSLIRHVYLRLLKIPSHSRAHAPAHPNTQSRTRTCTYAPAHAPSFWIIDLSLCGVSLSQFLSIYLIPPQRKKNKVDWTMSR